MLTWEAKKEAIFEMPVRTRERGRARERYPRARAGREYRARRVAVILKRREAIRNERGD